ncbi:MAG: hypothetical protein CMK23_08130 [Porticoccaceae bacterium]|nr:hypothetical protein [Porticoccaceae bacterium]|tara:strand:- start:1408 stop:1593 length:186 start_codon:yes stop_codon:yes gene_type:complete
MMFITEIKVIKSDGLEEIHSGPIIQARSHKEAQEKARTMNADLKVVGKYISELEANDELAI